MLKVSKLIFNTIVKILTNFKPDTVKCCLSQSMFDVVHFFIMNNYDIYLHDVFCVIEDASTKYI